jgi:hypothetical protein
MYKRGGILTDRTYHNTDIVQLHLYDISPSTNPINLLYCRSCVNHFIYCQISRPPSYVMEADRRYHELN